MTHIHQQLKREREDKKIMAEWISEAESYDMDEKAQINVRVYDIAEWWQEKLHASNLRVAKSVLQMVREGMEEEPKDIILPENESMNGRTKYDWEGQDLFRKGQVTEKSRLRLALDTLERNLEDKI